MQAKKRSSHRKRRTKWREKKRAESSPKMNKTNEGNEISHLRVNRQHTHAQKREHKQMKEDIKNRKRSSVFYFQKGKMCSVFDSWDLFNFLNSRTTFDAYRTNGKITALIWFSWMCAVSLRLTRISFAKWDLDELRKICKLNWFKLAALVRNKQANNRTLRALAYDLNGKKAKNLYICHFTIIWMTYASSLP